MSPASGQSTTRLDPRQSLAYWLLAGLLVFAPLFRSGQPPFAVLSLELGGLALGVIALWRPSGLPNREGIPLVLLLLFPLFYLIPLPEWLARFLPGREPYWDALAHLTGGAISGPFWFSLYPAETESAWLFLFIPLGVFLGVRLLPSRAIFQLVLLLLGLAAAQALLGLLQYVATRGSPLFFGIPITDLASASGTYTNRNHLAALLNLTFPIAVALTLYHVGHRRRAEGRRDWRDRIAFLASLGGHLAFLYAMIAFLLLLGIVFTRSRAGIGLAILGVLLSTLLFSRRIGGDNVYGSLGTIITLAVGSSLAIGLLPVLDRFSVGGTIQDARWTLFSATLGGIGTFAPLGSGPGDYPDLFPRFQPVHLGHWFINHAHNDYLEWLFEGGIPAALLIALFLALYIRRWGWVWKTGIWSRFRFVQVASGIGLLSLLLHSLVDYNLHIPANVLFFAFLAGVFFSPVDLREEETARHRRKRRRRTPDLKPGEEAPPPTPMEKRSIPPDQIPNPFLDP